jgi:predicted DNA-binding transcriptional regulator YafY
MSSPEEITDKLIREAIGQKRLLRFVYQGKDRVVEPHDYGIYKGSVKLLAYQVGGSSSGRIPNWRWIEADQIGAIELLSKTFPGGRPVPTGQHHDWEMLYARVGPSK